MQNKKSILSSSDIWIIQTIIHCTYDDQKASLEDLISVGDMINHAIFTPGELQNGIIYFNELGLIEFIGKQIILTEKSKNIFQSIIENKLSISEEQKRISEILNADIYDPKRPLPQYDDTKSSLSFTSNEYSVACKSYHEKARKIINKLIKK